MKSRLLKGIGIAYLVLGIILLISCLIVYAGMELVLSELANQGATQEDIAAMQVVLTTVFVMGLVIGVLDLVAGVVGIGQKNPKVCIILGIILVVSVIADFVYNIGYNPLYESSQIVYAVIGFLLPAVYLYGAIKLKKDREMQLAQQENEVV